ncbi:MAG TPA: DUF4367 domain-containing protein [Candidatus Saccharimonadales bacterium]|nr:DUF4367 domain-containing protein [Candidatus Saccharimonadales bacterium]
MSRAASIIEINGRAYDTTTGDVVGTVKKVATHVKDQSKAIDGFVRKSGTYAKAKTEAVRPKKPLVARKVTSAKAVHNRTQKSHALMRAVVAKPRTESQHHQAKHVKPSLSRAVGVEQERRSRASAIQKDEHVKRFGLLKPAAKRAEKPQTIVAKARPMGAKPQAATQAAAPVMPSMVVSASHQRLERMLDEALVRADAHKEMLRRRSRNPLVRFSRLPKWLTIAILLIVLLLAASLIAWRDVPQVAIKVAGQQAHVNAGLPGYAPSGFSVAGHISHSSGAVTVQYKDSSSGYSYDITQRSSSWDSSSMAANVLSPNSQVQTSQVQGTTVYIYGKQNDATWVNNGVWYTLKNNASLSSDQILRIVQSL